MTFVFCFQEIIGISQKQVLPSDKISYFGIHESLVGKKDNFTLRFYDRVYTLILSVHTVLYNLYSLK